MKGLFKYLICIVLTLSLSFNALFFLQVERLTTLNSELTAALNVATAAYLDLLLNGPRTGPSLPLPSPPRKSAARPLPWPEVSIRQCSTSGSTGSETENALETLSKHNRELRNKLYEWEQIGDHRVANDVLTFALIMTVLLLLCFAFGFFTLDRDRKILRNQIALLEIERDAHGEKIRELQQDCVSADKCSRELRAEMAKRADYTRKLRNEHDNLKRQFESTVSVANSYAERLQEWELWHRKAPDEDRA